ncbi:hypothetical protein [Actinomadura sp. GTD37]|uniref:hypothetical protein n=1 Tax=Actinomadura sp. GTD37 TaxID=1778030 RepID=UPI0035C141E4
MKFSASSLVGAAVVAPFAAALAVAAVPASAAPADADAAPGPSTALLYDAAAAANPAVRTLPEPVVRTGGRTAEAATGAADGALRAMPGASGLRRGTDHCTLNPGKAVNSHAGTSLPETPLDAAGQKPLGGLPKGACLDATRAGARDRTSGTDALAGPVGTAGRALSNVGGAVRGSTIGQIANAPSALPAGRRAAMPVSMALPDALPGGLPVDLPNVPAALAAAQPGGLPVGAVLFPPRERRAGSGTPVPSDEVLGQANGAVNKAGASIDQTEDGVGQVVDVLKTRDRGARRADGPLSNGPLSMPDASALGLPALPGIG